MSGSKAPAKNNSFWTAVLTIVWKDLRIEKHTRQIISVMIMFSLVTVIMFNFAVDPEDLAAARNVATGLLWATILLSGTLGLNRSLAIEQENRTIDAVLMGPVERSAIYLGKVISVTIFSYILEAALVVLFVVFFNKPFYRPMILLMLVMGTLGYVAAGVLITSMTIQTRTREVLLPVLLLPLSLPLVLPAATVVASYMTTPPPEFIDVQSGVLLVLIYDLLMLTTGFLTYHYVVES
ncbi:MAG: heme exporter protein CcmB [Anaerolineae bacterium]